MESVAVLRRRPTFFVRTEVAAETLAEIEEEDENSRIPRRRWGHGFLDIKVKSSSVLSKDDFRQI